MIEGRERDEAIPQAGLGAVPPGPPGYGGRAVTDVAEREIDPQDVVLRIRGLVKTFGGNHALRGVDLDIAAGEVHGLVGHNGSGKSTLIKTLAGFYHADPHSGAEAWLDGVSFDLARVGVQRHERLRFVHQDLGLVLEMNALENLALRSGFARTRLGSIRWDEQERAVRATIARFGVHLDVHRPLAEATPVERTVVAIAGALQGWQGGRAVLVLDEPTAVLPPGEVDQLLGIVREIRAQGASVLYVSHRLDEIFALCDRVTVMRGGQVVATREVSSLTKHELVTLMLGEESAADGAPPAPPAPLDVATVLEARDLETGYLRGASIELRSGEILGLAGRPGSGREDLAYLLGGGLAGSASGEIRRPADEGRWRRLTGRSEPDIALVPADRGLEGMFTEFSVRENLTLGVLPRFGRRGWVGRRAEAALTRDWLGRLEVGTAGSEVSIATLSGGNQQKVLIGRSLVKNPAVLVLCEPTAGVDIGTRHALYRLIRAQVAETGLSVIVSSSDVGDLLALCDRVLVFDGGAVVRELSGAGITEVSLVHAMEGIDSGHE
jgi:ABC-type sugar transport system ATPase subunit